MERRLGMVTILLATDDQVMGGLLKEKINSQSDMRVIYETHRINVICASGARSKRAVKVLRNNGVEAYNIKGGTSQNGT